ncbi:esterase/lipase family protein [Actinoplanes couchii]|uniref:DUF676 domain-containing protein n=1 Tax=Actinoplanes couchii TaxID=403638 RepID=A0ABQ3XBK0_9ACTN|nr:hypothetical protein [Actinoplanes couchii]MDR6323337.1 hypothetical protein [Actinoplanes couchii]GID55850.1 hypothetical protein Aco03nite_042540 [Actinoplanes couchii]
MMKRFVVRVAGLIVGVGLGVVVPGGAQAAAVPKRNDGLNETIYWVHGIQVGPKVKVPVADCKQWDAAVKRYRGGSFTGTVRTVGYYKNDKNCNAQIARTDRNTSIKELGRLLAWDIYNNYTKKGKSVDAVGHSMGGLIIRSAITGVQKKLSGWPPRLFVEDVVTFSTPHSGTLFANACGFTQCKEMRIDSSFLKWLSKTPYSTQRTDWTLIGSTKDIAVPAWSATVTDAKKAGYFTPGHRVVFTDGKGLSHSGIYKQTANSGYKVRYWNAPQASQGWIKKTNHVSPVVMARNGNYYFSKW